ncbi:hypothetical protein PRZ48_010157 [Zasmidium cellare]|uniref:Uncharacterized protein n=1 Tax=Zasmidium cellare TaxID=395010 RepID=A0ABR0EDR5_ZASCE|nr:hypothetical protein PRZ48_010157 [Zasmidium cellare]
MDNSPLAKLSPELRNRVYEYALIFDDTQLHVTADHYNAKMHTTNECAQLRPLALTTTCRQIRQETSQMFYHYNTFNIHFEKHTEDQDRDETCLLQRFSANMGGVNATNLRRIAVTIGRESFMAEVPGRVDDIRHQLLVLRTFALASPNCEVLCKFSWAPRHTSIEYFLPGEEWMSDVLLLPLVQFRVGAGPANLSNAITQLDKEIEDFRGNYVEESVRLVVLLKKLVDDPFLSEDHCFWAGEDCGYSER